MRQALDLREKKVDGNAWRTLLIKSNPKHGNWWGCDDVDGKEPNPCDEREYGVVLNSDERYVGIDGTTEDHYRNGGHTWCNTPPGSIQYGRWHHVGAVISPKSRAMRVYIDGALVTTCPMSEAGLRRTTDKLYIGAGMVGMLDEVRVYAAELGDADIAGLAKAE
jgi:hypothetical protein